MTLYIGNRTYFTDGKNLYFKKELIKKSKLTKRQEEVFDIIVNDHRTYQQTADILDVSRQAIEQVYKHALINKGLREIKHKFLYDEIRRIDSVYAPKHQVILDELKTTIDKAD